MGSQESDRSGNGNYSLTVKDFGPIARASVEFRPLTVFVGPSNTGKSYLAILVYALHRCFESYGFRVHRQPRLHSPSRGLGRVKLSESELAGWSEWFDALEATESMPPLPRDVAAAVRRALEALEGFDWTLEGEMHRVFGVDHGGELVRRAGSQTTACVDLQIPRGDSRPPVQYEFTVGQRSTRLSGHVADELIGIETAPLAYVEEMSHVNLRPLAGKAHESQYGVAVLLDELLASLLAPLTRSAFYLPASRTGIMNTHQALVSALIRDAARAGIESTPRVGRLAGVIADFLDQLVRMSSGRHWRRRTSPSAELHDLAEGLEDRVLGGAVRRARGEIDYPVFAYRPRGWEDDLPLMRTSSMVSELAPLVLYLRHLVQPGDVLIIEEPESHLHPAKQTELARELARVVHAGVRIILTTHSEWFVEQISNLVRLADLPAARRAGIPGADVALGRDQVGVWLFKESKRPKGSVVREVELDDDTGLFPAGYDAVSEALYNDSARTFNRLQGSRAK